MRSKPLSLPLPTSAEINERLARYNVEGRLGELARRAGVPYYSLWMRQRRGQSVRVEDFNLLWPHIAAMEAAPRAHPVHRARGRKKPSLDRGGRVLDGACD